jgi:hypothetical protein
MRVSKLGVVPNSRWRSSMFRKLATVLVVVLVMNVTGVRLAYAESKEEKQARFAEKVKADVLKLGTGESSRVKVKLRDQVKLEGYISDAGPDTFTVTDRKTGVATTVAYPQVKSVQGNNLSTGAKIAIGVAIAATIIFIILWFTTGPGSD